MLSACNLEQNISNKVKENKQNWTRAETFDICFGITFGHCYKGDTYRTNKFIKNNKFVVLEEAISELSHKE